MGQAFDKYGNVLGEISGETKKEVFDKLNAMHPNAAEIQIKTMAERLEADRIVERAKASAAPDAAPDRMMQFFKFDHLPENLQAVSRPFCELAGTICETVPSNPERTVALRKLLEAKDCAVRAVLFTS